MAVEEDEKSFACQKLNSKETLGNEIPIRVSLFRLCRLQL